MNQEERKQKIDSILEEAKRHGRMSGNGIPIELWIDAQDGKPGDPAFEEWLKCCTEAVDDYEAMTGKKDHDSVFAEYVRKYGRRERKCERAQEIKEKLFNGDQ